MLPLETLSFRFWFEVMTPRLISSHHECQELIPFPGIVLQMINTVGLAEIQVGDSQSPSIQSKPLSLRLRHFWSPKKGSEGANGSPWMTTTTCGTGSQHSPRNFTRQPFTTLCRSGTSASTTRANTSDIQVLVSVPRLWLVSFLMLLIY